MGEKLSFESREEFLAKLRELQAAGADLNRAQIHMPFLVPEVEQILGTRPGLVRFFAVAGGLSGFLGGLGFTIYTVLSWPLITGGKPIISLPPFLLISYILTILFGSLATFGGFLLLARLPSPRGMAPEQEHGNRFVIILPGEEGPWKR
ncbi:hypothetical protein DESUT3_03540 [Desulfuromonas versatilis]|uniref:DUF3341 domain-containing protein n=1 Tax=Desulfuromonas versatilis TaxID=2802975 RepID=A0ABM8HP33_9BACT|nr:quinol:electron acceptor oxidoreductase subunit ActD [Desulfuromonas versatilis]BCR03285.1 hypothetical protein DESUT3_03540 [Desulfuromonas versatilis]